MITITKSPLIAARVIEGKAYIVTAQTSQLHELDEVGTFLWQALDKTTSYEKLTDMLTATYEISRAQAAADLTSFLRDLARQGLITLA